MTGTLADAQADAKKLLGPIRKLLGRNNVDIQIQGKLSEYDMKTLDELANMATTETATKEAPKLLGFEAGKTLYDKK